MGLGFKITIISVLISFALSANPWVQKADFGGVGRHRATGISIANRGYIGLGHVNGSGVDISYKDWWAYDPASNSWTQKANFPVNNHGAVAFSSDTKGYVGGGSALNAEFFEYDPLTNIWTPIQNCPLNVGDTQGFSVQNKGYVYNGNQIAEFDPSTNSWMLKANAPISFMTWSCAFGTESSGFIKSGTSFYEFKPALNQWIMRAYFPGLISNGSAAFTRDNKGYVTCGFSGGLSTVTDEVWEFNPGNNTWTFICNFPGTNRRFPVAFAIHNKGYFGTGTNGINMNDFWQFDFDPLNIDELDFDKIKVEVYPNPSNDLINFQLEGIDQIDYNQLELAIYTSDGRLISNHPLKSNSISIERNEQPSGVYFYSIQFNKKVFHTGKLMYF